jgi:hypothetical protein
MRAAAYPMLPKVLLTLAVVGTVGALAGTGAFSAFTATTSNTGNSFSTGTVVVGQHSGATTLYSASNQGPGGSTVACVRVSYTGSLASSVKLYTSSISNGTLFNLKIERGSGLSSPDNTMNCTGFTASSTAFNTTMDSLPTSYGAGIDGKASGTAWSQNDSVDYRFTITALDDSTPNAHTSSAGTGSHSFTWEARNN